METTKATNVGIQGGSPSMKISYYDVTITNPRLELLIFLNGLCVFSQWAVCIACVIPNIHAWKSKSLVDTKQIREKLCRLQNDGNF